MTRILKLTAIEWYEPNIKEKFIYINSVRITHFQEIDEFNYNILKNQIEGVNAKLSQKNMLAEVDAEINGKPTIESKQYRIPTKEECLGGTKLWYQTDTGPALMWVKESPTLIQEACNA